MWIMVWCWMLSLDFRATTQMCQEIPLLLQSWFFWVTKSKLNTMVSCFGRGCYMYLKWKKSSLVSLFHDIKSHNSYSTNSWYSLRYGYHQRENTGSCRFTEVKPCWTGLISGWVTISIKYPVLYSLGSQAGVVDINHAFHLYYCNVVCGLSFSRSQPDFEGFLRALRFPPSAKLTPC